MRTPTAIVLIAALAPRAGFALPDPPVMALPGGAGAAAARMERVQSRTCSRRFGPYVTQTTAWQRRNAARARGYQVSGVVPCWQGGTRGYCFNLFYRC